MKSKFRIENVVNKRAHFGNDIPTTTYERKYLLFPNDNAVTSTLFNNEIYEPWLYQFLIDNKIDINSSTVIDIGANNGQVSVEFAHLVGDSGKVYSFEPQRLIFYQLCANVFYNGLDNVYTNNVALGNNTGKITIEKPDYFSNENVNFGDVHVGVSENYELVELRTLDSYNFENISIIKIDVQGFEKEVLLGAKKTIIRNRPLIYIEIEPDQLGYYGETEESIFNLLKEYNYFTKRFNEGIPFSSTSGKCLDFVCIPNEYYQNKNWIIK